MRKRDWHILTSGRHVFTADNRFQILRPIESNQTAKANLTEWILQIQFVEQTDGGFYICQVRHEANISPGLSPALSIINPPIHHQRLETFSFKILETGVFQQSSLTSAIVRGLNFDDLKRDNDFLQDSLNCFESESKP